MGNYVSCTTANASAKYPKGTKIIFPSGEIRQLDQPINAAELMLESPNHFLVNSCSLHVGRRFSALAADEDLEMGHIYVLFPMRRLNSVITAADMDSLLMAANSAVRRSSGGKTRILPDFGVAPQVQMAQEEENWQENSQPRLNLDEIEDDSIVEFKARMTMCRSRKPMLETIAEESIFSH